MIHAELIQYAVAYTLVGVFIFTCVITCLSVIGKLKIPDKKQQQWLFRALIGEIVIGAVSFFTGILKYNPAEISDRFERIEEKLKTQEKELANFEALGKSLEKKLASLEVPIDLLTRYDHMLAENGQKDLRLSLIISQYEKLKQASLVWQRHTGASRPDDEGLVDELIKTLKAQIPQMRVGNDVPGGALIINTGSNSFQVIFPAPMRIPPKITFTGLPPGTSGEVDKSRFGFTVVFKPLSTPVSSFGFEANADF